jgi:sarcosine oxidase subunit delta
VYEFRFGGEYQVRPEPSASSEAWARYLYFRSSEAGVQKEWWYHRSGCRAWFLALRDTRTNAVLEVIRPEAT